MFQALAGGALKDRVRIDSVVARRGPRVQRYAHQNLPDFRRPDVPGEGALADQGAG